MGFSIGKLLRKASPILKAGVSMLPGGSLLSRGVDPLIGQIGYHGKNQPQGAGGQGGGSQGGGGFLQQIMSMLGGGSMGDFMSGQGPQEVRSDIYNQGQGNMMDWLMNQGQQNMDFSGLEDQAMKRFNEDIIPSLAERFTSMGSGGGQRSSAFQSSLGRAGSDISTQLAALKPQYGMQQMQMGLRPRSQVSFQGGGPGMIEGLIGQLPQMMKYLPQLLGSLKGSK